MRSPEEGFGGVPWAIPATHVAHHAKVTAGLVSVLCLVGQMRGARPRPKEGPPGGGGGAGELLFRPAGVAERPVGADLDGLAFGVDLAAFSQCSRTVLSDSRAYWAVMSGESCRVFLHDVLGTGRERITNHAEYLSAPDGEMAHLPSSLLL